MSTKVKKQATSLSFSLSRWFQKISTARPSNLLVTLVILGGAIFLFGGGLYDIIVQPMASFYTQNKFYFLYPDLGSQFLFDTVLSAMLYVLGLIGLLSIYQSSRHAYNPRSAYMQMILGVTLLLISYILLEYFIHLKLLRV
jgi:hypothetical protein